MEVTINFTKREAKLVEYAAELNKLNVEEYIRKVIMEYVQAELSSDKYNKTFDLEELKQIVAPIADKYGLEAVYLFGSQARGDAKPNSDYDFYVKRGKMRGLFQLSGLFIDLKKALHKEVDIVLEPVTKRKLDNYLIEGIKKDSILIYENLNNKYTGDENG